MIKKAKIINIMPGCPHYDLFWDEPKPEIMWDMPDGTWIGIWGLDWLDLIGYEVLKLTDEYEYEVWQPDLRADKCYSHVFRNGVVHKLFPALQKERRYGFRARKYVVSQAICASVLSEIRKSNVILRLEVMNHGIGREIMGAHTNSPKIAQFWGEFRGPVHDLLTWKFNVLGKLSDIKEHGNLKKCLSKVDVVTCSDARSQNNLTSYFNGEILSLSIGIDADFWKSDLGKTQARELLGLEKSKFIFLSSCRLNPLKQIDKVIGVLSRIREGHDFLYIVTGHGMKEYEGHLRYVGRQLIADGKLKFVGQVSNDSLKAYYSSADLFIMSSFAEAGPTASIKALAMEIPVFTSDTGQMAEVMAEHAAGVIVPRRDYRVWERELREILSGKRVKILDREIVKKIHHWPYVAQQYIDLYERLFKKYYG